MKKKTKNNLLNEKILSGGSYAYIYDKEDNSLIGEALNELFNKWGDTHATSASTTATITTTDSIADDTVFIGSGGSGSWALPYYPTATAATTATTATTTTGSTITIPYYSEEFFEDEDESFYVISDTFEEGEELSPKRKFTEGVKEVCFSMVAVPSKQMKKYGVIFPVYFYTPKKRIKEGEKIPSGNYFCHNNTLWKKCYSKKMTYDEFFKSVEIYFC